MANFSTHLGEYLPGQTQFVWHNVLYSDTAKQNNLLGSQYSISDTIEQNLTNLTTNILAPLYAAFPFKVNVAFRSSVVNALVGGAQSSQHLIGQAADIQGINGVTNQQLFNYIVANLPFDQVIWEKGTTPPSGQPQWVHVSYGPRNRREQLYFNGSSYTTINNSSPPNAGNNSIGSQANSATEQKDEDPALVAANDKELPADFEKTFEQITRNVANIEASEVNVGWGQGLPGDDSGWIGLKQYLLYLATRYVPQSVFPFVELIPVTSVQGSLPSTSAQKNSETGTAYERDQGVPAEVEKNVTGKKKSKLSSLIDQARFATSAAASNAASGVADLFALDPFKEGIEFMGELSEAGQAVFDQRNIGVRAYGQLVLSPAPIPGVPSKPGAVGFTNLEIQAGSQSDNGLALISMELKDIQGNKFTDINSPWAFIYDVRPGSAGGDFYFRYGWQVRLPMPNDNADLNSKGFWNHEGWAQFPAGIRTSIQQQLQPGKQYITLTQSLNVGPSEEANVNPNDPTQRLALFDEGIDFDASTGKVKISRKLVEDNYVKISILNPELGIDTMGVATAKLSFRTTGAITKLIPITYAITTRKLLALDKKINLGDLLLAIEDDCAKFGYLNLDTKEKRLRAEDSRSQLTFRSASSGNRQFPNVFIVGPEQGAMTGNIHPDDIKIKVPKKLRNMMLNPAKENDLTIIRWFRQVLQENECELQSAATGSGAGINAAWIITTTQKIDQAISSKRKVKATSGDPNANLISFMQTEKDVFAFRFKGSLIESINVEKTDSPNALKIQADFTVGDFADGDTEKKSKAEIAREPANDGVTKDDRQRNLTIVFSQLQNITISAICHPWIAPGKRFFVKGMGFNDGEYLCLQVTHKLEGHKFTSELQGARMLVNGENEQNKEEKENAATNGSSNFSKPVSTQQDSNTAQNKVPGAANAIPPVQSLNQNGYLVTLEQLIKISKNRNQKALEKVIGPLNETLKKYNVNTYNRICHFLAQVMHESGEFAWYREFASGQAYEGRADLGNTQAGDGPKYKGRGAIQITGRANYTKISNDFGVDFVNQPALLEQTGYGTQAAGWYWDRRGLNTYADQDDIRTITKRINGGFNGLTSRAYYLQQAKVVLIGLKPKA